MKSSSSSVRILFISPRYPALRKKVLSWEARRPQLRLSPSRSVKASAGFVARKEGILIMPYAEVALLLVTAFWGVALRRAYTDERPYYPTAPHSEDKREPD